MFSQTGQDFSDVLRMFRGIVGVDEDVVEVDDDVDVKKVAKDVLHETLESSGGVAEAEGHDHHLKESVAGQ